MQDIPIDRNAWRIVIRRNVVKQNRNGRNPRENEPGFVEVKLAGGKSLCRKESVVTEWLREGDENWVERILVGENSPLGFAEEIRVGEIRRVLGRTVYYAHEHHRRLFQS